MREKGRDDRGGFEYSINFIKACLCIREAYQIDPSMRCYWIHSWLKRKPSFAQIRCRIVQSVTLNRFLLLAAGFLALCWFCIRVIPKPQRAMYPCQRAAFPLASTFVIWMLGMFALGKSSSSFLRYFRSGRYGLATMAMVVTMLATLAIFQGPIVERLLAAPSASTITPNLPIGTGKGVFPGRVVWVHNPEATNWAGPSSGLHWAEPDQTDMLAVEEMFRESILQLAGQTTLTDAWEALFVAFNTDQGRGVRGYEPGEKFMIKSNLTTAAARNNVVNRSTYVKNKSSYLWSNIDPAPQLTLALLRHLVYEVGVAEKDITVGDPTAMFPNMFFDLFAAEFPDVRYLDNYGGKGRTRSEFSDVPFCWSTPDADTKLQDYIPVSFAEADYLINLAVLKTHGSSGITVCAKNHYGSLLRCPDGLLQDEGVKNFYHLHHNLPKSNQGLGKYRSLVDLMGHPELGGKTFLCIVDGLYSGLEWKSIPTKWKSPPFNNDWPSSIFVSMDQVAIDSVAYDFLRMEFPQDVAVWGDAPVDYLVEAAWADSPPSGTFYDPAGTGEGLRSLGVQEHWNNNEDKQYSRNLGTGEGIELRYERLANIGPRLSSPITRLAGEDWLIYFPNLTPGQTVKVQKTHQLDAATWENLEQSPSAGYGKRIRQTATGPDEAVFYRLLVEE